MRKCLLAIVPLAGLLVAPAPADYYVAGDFNGWDPGHPDYLMTDDGGGMYSLSITLGPDERHEFKITDGTWDDAWPETGNSWLYTDPDGHIGIGYDTNTYADGWLGATERIPLDWVPDHQWTVASDLNGWNNDDPDWYMTSVGGIEELVMTVAEPGTFQWKAVEAGTWDSIGADARSVNAANMEYTTTVPDETVVFQVAPLMGITRAIPEPATLVGLLLGLGLLRRR